MSNFTVYRGECSAKQLRDVLLMAMTIKDIKEIEEAMSKSGYKTPRSPDHVFLPANWQGGYYSTNKVEFCSYDRIKIIKDSGSVVSARTVPFNVSRRADGVFGVSFWELTKIRKKSKSGNVFEATQNFEILEMGDSSDHLFFGVTFNVCLSEAVCVTERGFKLHSHWLDFLRAAKVELKEFQE